MRMAALGAMVWAAGCGVDTSGAGSGNAGSGHGYQGAGSQWTAQLDSDHTFRLLHFAQLGDVTADQLINGSDDAGDDGLLSLTVTSSAGTGQPAEGAGGFAFEVPQALFVLQPFAPGNWVPMVPNDSCPGAALAANLVLVKPARGWTAASSAGSATFTYDPSSGVANVPAQYALGDASMPLGGGALSLGGGSCHDGAVALDSGAELFVSAWGAVVVHTQPTAEAQALDAVWLGLPQAAVAVDLGTLAGSYGGLVYVDGASTAANAAVAITLAADGTGSATPIADGGALAGAQLTLTGAGGANGLVSGTIDTTGPSGGGMAQPLACAVTQAAGDQMQTIVACAGSSASGDFVSLIAASH